MKVASGLIFQHQAELSKTTQFLESLLQEQVAGPALDWLLVQKKKLEKDESRASLFMAFSAVSRYFNVKRLEVSEADKIAAETMRSGFKPQFWNQQQAARSLLLLSSAHTDAEQFTRTLDRLAETADVAEQTALYAALPILPYPEALRKRAAEGLRTNMTVVFDAIALHNPYPADFLSQTAWNQMVLKAVFMNRPLYQIWGAEHRTNEELAQMLLDFAHERWAAHRTVTPELWRFIGPYLNEASFKEVESLSRKGTELEQQAVLLACADSTLPLAKELLAQRPELAQEIRAGALSWHHIGEQCSGVGNS